jgi:hypothetical protein
MSYEQKSKALRDHLYAEEIDEFELLLQQVFSDKSSDAVECLIRTLEENDDYHDEMYQILHAAEAYPMETYLQGLLAGFNKPPADSYWLGMLILRVMNDQNYLSMLQSMTGSLSPESKSNLKKIVVAASTQNPDFLGRSRELLKTLN